MGISAYLVCDTCKHRIALGPYSGIQFDKIIEERDKYIPIIDLLKECTDYEKRTYLIRDMDQLIFLLETLKKHASHDIRYWDEHMGDFYEEPWIEGFTDGGNAIIKKGWQIFK